VLVLRLLAALRMALVLLLLLLVRIAVRGKAGFANGGDAFQAVGVLSQGGSGAGGSSHEHGGWTSRGRA